MKRRVCLLDADYIIEDGKTIVRLFGKDASGKTVVIHDSSFEPYFYILPKKGKEQEVKSKVEKLMERNKQITKAEAIERSVSGEKRKLVRVFCATPPSVPEARDEVKSWSDVEEQYEYSINFYRRYMIDRGISGMGWVEVEGNEIKNQKYQADLVIESKSVKSLSETKIPKLKVLAFDIESFEEAGKSKIIMLSLHSPNFNKVITYHKDHYPKYVEIVKGEKDLLERFVQVVNEQDCDVLLGYNSDGFDFQIIQQRADELKVDLALSRDGSHLKFARRARISTARLKGRLHLDLFVFISTVLGQQMQTEVSSLDAVASELLGDKKISLELEDILETWRKKKDLGKLAEYCLKDSELAFRLGELIIPQILELSKLVGQLPFDTSRMAYSQLVEWYLSKRAFEKKEIIPNQPKWEEVEERRMRRQYVGGYVKEPIGGLHENIAVLDFRSLYPSIIATFNISPETLNKNGSSWEVPETKYKFGKSPRGFVSESIEELIKRRAEVKKAMQKAKEEGKQRLNNEQFAIKTIANAMYGSFGFAGAKWYCIECAESSAAFGRFYIKKVIDEAEKHGFVVLYADTDSCFVKLSGKGGIEASVKKFLKKINQELPGILELDLQGIYKRGIFIPRGVGPGTAKKRYALLDSKGKMLIRGLEKVRKDWSLVAKDTQEEVLSLILDKKDVKGAVKHVKEVIKKIRDQKIPLGELVVHEQLTKPLEEYKAIGPHVSAARKIKERGRPYGPGMIVMFVIRKGKGSISERAEPIEDAKLEDIDSEYYIEHQVVPAALRVLQVLGIEEKEFLGEKQKRLK